MLPSLDSFLFTVSHEWSISALTINAGRRLLTLKNIPLSDIESALEKESDSSADRSAMNEAAPPHKKDSPEGEAS